MAVAHLSKNKKSVKFITDEGEVFITSTVYLKSLVEGKLKVGFILLQRLPFSVSPDRFAKSPTIWPEHLKHLDTGDQTTDNDSLSRKFEKTKELTKAFIDKPVWDDEL